MTGRLSTTDRVEPVAPGLPPDTGTAPPLDHDAGFREAPRAALPLSDPRRPVG
jgi:hypothetical protein